MKIVAPTTLQEAVRVTPEQIYAMSDEELVKLHSILLDGKTKTAAMKRDQVEGQLNARRKAEKAKSKSQLEAAVTTEPVANSVKTGGKTVTARAKTTKATAAKTTKGKAAGAKETNAAPKTAAKVTTSKPPAPPAGKKGTDAFEESIESSNAVYNIFKPEDLKHLQQIAASNPYSVYLLIDEKYDDKELTYCLVTYVSENLLLAVDKSREVDTFFDSDAKGIAATFKNTFIDRAGDKFPAAYYIRSAKGSN